MMGDLWNMPSRLSQANLSYLGSTLSPRDISPDSPNLSGKLCLFCRFSCRHDSAFIKCKCYHLLTERHFRKLYYYLKLSSVWRKCWGGMTTLTANTGWELKVYKQKTCNPKKSYNSVKIMFLLYYGIFLYRKRQCCI